MNQVYIICVSRYHYVMKMRTQFCLVLRAQYMYECFDLFLLLSFFQKHIDGKLLHCLGKYLNTCNLRRIKVIHFFETSDWWMNDIIATLL